MAQRIDKIFSQWSNTNTPGVAIGVVRNDSLVYAKGYGMANPGVWRSYFAGNRFSYGIGIETVCSIRHRTTGKPG